MIFDPNDPLEVLAAKIAPRLQAILDPRRDNYIEMARPQLPGYLRPMAHPIGQALWRVGMAEIPLVVRDGLQLVADEFGQMNVNDLLAFLARTAKLSPQVAATLATKLQVHYGVM